MATKSVASVNNDSTSSPSSLSAVVEQVSPAIVSIYTKVTIEANPAEIFGPFMFHEPKKIEREALGSGVIVTRRGLIVTNDHVIEKADKIKVITADEQQYNAEVVVRDGLHDIAIIRIINEDEDEMDDQYDDNNNDNNNNNNNNNSANNDTNDNNNNEDDEAAAEEEEDYDYDNDNDDEIDASNSKTVVESSNNTADNNNNNKAATTTESGAPAALSSGVPKYQTQTKRRKKNNGSSNKRRYHTISLSDEIAKEPSDGRRSFPYLTMGSAEFCKVGDYVLAIGNNLGFHGTVTDGIISAIGRTNDERLPIAYPQFPLIQTNASINPGSSGGALVNMKGELIGINESIATSTGGNVGVGFAVPVNFIRPLLRSSMKKSFYDIERVWDGISPLSCPIAILPNDQVDSILDVKVNEDKKRDINGLRVSSHQKRAYPRGIRVKSIHRESPAALAGIRRNDVILKINGIDIDNINTYYLMIAGADPNKSMKYEIVREVRKKGRRNTNKNNTNNNNRGRARSRSPSSNNRRNNTSRSTSVGSGNSSNNSNRSWIDFENRDLKTIDVTIELIPLPEKKPLEIKDRLNPFYGAQIVELCPLINSDFGLDFSQTGVAILDVEPGSQASKLGFKMGDIIISIDNQRLRTLEDIEMIGDRLQTRKSCRIKFKRNGKFNHVDVYLRSRRRIFSRL